jgi:uncharacterized damage-inducible protein DinB
MPRHPLDDAFRHNAWATVKLIDACAELRPEQLATPTPGTYGSIDETLRHIVGSDGWYLSFFRDKGVVRFEGDALPDLVDLRAGMTSNGALWIDVLNEWPDADHELEEVDGDERYVATVGVRLAQVVHHGTDHRSQICTALTLLGIEPPDIAVWAYGNQTGRAYDAEVGPAAGA